VKLYPFLVSLAGCASVPSSGVPVTGQWGGTHIGLTLDAAGGQITYDCASGTIGPIVPGSDGQFSVPGTHTAGHGGPIRQGEIMPTRAVIFSGTVRSGIMTLQGRVDNGVELGPFSLKEGAEPGIFRCL
jgi:hypothetical protein